MRFQLRAALVGFPQHRHEEFPEQAVVLPQGTNGVRDRLEQSPALKRPVKCLPDATVRDAAGKPLADLPGDPRLPVLRQCVDERLLAGAPGRRTVSAVADHVSHIGGEELTHRDKGAARVDYIPEGLAVVGRRHEHRGHRHSEDPGERRDQVRVELADALAVPAPLGRRHRGLGPAAELLAELILRQPVRLPPAPHVQGDELISRDPAFRDARTVAAL